jgi:hypothetical protein
MKTNSVRVALNMSKLPVPQKIRQAKLNTEAIAANASVFTNPGSLLTDANTAIDELELAFEAAADRAKSKVAQMNDKEVALMEAMRQLAAYVEKVAKGNPEVVHMAGMYLKTRGVANLADFSVKALDKGMVSLKIKPRKNTIYKWQYSVDQTDANGTWVDALHSHVSKVTLSGLKPGIYFFRVVFIDKNGESTSEAISFAVN